LKSPGFGFNLPLNLSSENLVSSLCFQMQLVPLQYGDAQSSPLQALVAAAATKEGLELSGRDGGGPFGMPAAWQAQPPRKQMPLVSSAADAPSPAFPPLPVREDKFFIGWNPRGGAAQVEFSGSVP
jgi:hypothetical protein